MWVTVSVEGQTTAREKSVVSINMNVDVREKKNETGYITSRKTMTPMTGIKIPNIFFLLRSKCSLGYDTKI